MVKFQMSRSYPALTAFLPSDDHWKFALGVYKERITRAQLSYVLLHCPDPIYRGRLHRWESFHIGAGVYDLWISKDSQV